MSAAEGARLLITGAGGFVGARVPQYPADAAAFPRGMLATADADAVRAFVLERHPARILHLAALSDTLYCERHPEESYRANVQLCEWLARAARDAGAALVCISSDQVYNGCAGEGPFDEAQPLRPTNVYGRHKLEAEARALDIWPQTRLLRASWMYDLPAYRLPTHDNLPIRLIRAAARGEELRFSPREYRGVSYVRQVAELLEAAFALPGGVYNFGSENALNMWETALDFMRALGLEARAAQILRCDASRPPRSLAMNCEKMRKYGLRFDDTQQGIRRCARDYGL